MGMQQADNQVSALSPRSKFRRLSINTGWRLLKGPSSAPPLLPRAPLLVLLEGGMSSLG